MSYAVYATVVVVATAGLVYELVAAAAASYLLGDSLTQFSTVIGGYLFAMGVGSFLSRYVQRGVAARFVQIEIMVGLVGGWTAAVLFVAFGHTAHFRVILYGLVGLIGVLVGLEIPLLLRLLRYRLVFRELVAQVLSLDYIGALAASLLFPLLLVPHLGLIRTSLLVGLANAAVGLCRRGSSAASWRRPASCARSRWPSCCAWAAGWWPPSGSRRGRKTACTPTRSSWPVRRPTSASCSRAGTTTCACS